LKRFFFVKIKLRSWKWWFWHYNGFNVKAFLWLKRLLCKSVLRTIYAAEKQCSKYCLF